MTTDLKSFAETVNRIATSMPAAGRFGENKVYIFSLWCLGRFEVSLAEFKGLLAEANRLAYLNLSRADLVEAMDPFQVRQSELQHYGAEFHFVRIG